MSVSKFLAFDFGAESGRAIVGFVGDDLITLEEIHRFPNKQVSASGHLYWDIVNLFEELKNGLSLAVQKGHGDIESIGIDTWGIDFGLIGKNGKILESPFSYRDSRTDGIMEKVLQRISREEIYAATGIQFLQINSLYQIYSVAVDNKELLERCDTMLFMPDLFNYFITGKKYSEYTIASTSQLLNARKREWDEKIFQRLGLPLNIMAPIISPGSIIGTLLPEIANETGLKKEIDVVAVCCHDTASAVVSVPVQTDNWAFISSGTWSVIGIESAQPLINEEALMNNFTNEGGAGGTIRFLQNVIGLWLLQEFRKIWVNHGDSLSYNEVLRTASGTKEFKCLINPDDRMFLNPPDMTEAIKEYCHKTHQSIPESRGEFVRCIIESLALEYKSVIRKIESITKNRIRILHIVGGGSRNEMLNQFTADATGIPVFTGPVEATALGNILMQAMAKGKIKSVEEGRTLVARSFPIKKYNPSNSKVWDEVYHNKTLWK